MASFNVDIVLKARDEAMPVVAKLVDLTKQLGDRRKLLSKYTRSLTTATRGLAKATLQSTKALELAVPGLGKLVAETNKLNASTRSLGVARRGLLGDTRQLTQATHKLNETTRRTPGPRAARAPGAGAGAGTGTGRRGRGNDPFDFRQHRIAEALAGASANIGRLGQQARAAVSAPLELAMNFEQAMTEVRAVTGDAKFGENFDLLSAKARELGRTTEFTATDAAYAMKNLGVAGFSSAQQLAAIGPIMDGATVSGDSLEKTSSLLADTMGSFGIKSDALIDGVEGARYVMDSLTAANNASNTTLSELARGMFKAGPVAKTLGVEFNEVAALLGVLANAGIKGAQGGTALRNMMLSLTGKPSKDMRQLLKALGLDAKKLRNTLGNEGLAAGMRMLMTEMEHLDEPMRVFASNVLFGRYTTAPALNVMQKLGDEYANIRAQVDASRGASQRLATEFRSTHKAGAKALTSALQEMGITIGNELLPVLAPLMKDAMDAAKEFAEWAQANGAVVRTLGKLLIRVAIIGAVLAPVLLTLSSITSVLTLGRTAWLLFGGGAAAAGTQAAAGGAAAAAGATKAAKAARLLTIALNPIAVLLASIAAASAIIDVAQNSIEKQTDDAVGRAKGDTKTVGELAKTSAGDQLDAMIATTEKTALQYEANSDAKRRAAGDSWHGGMLGSLFNRGRDQSAELAVEARERLAVLRAERERRRVQETSAMSPALPGAIASARQAAAEANVAKIDAGGEIRIKFVNGVPVVEGMEQGDIPISVENGLFAGGI